MCRHDRSTVALYRQYRCDGDCVDHAVSLTDTPRHRHILHRRRLSAWKYYKLRVAILLGNFMSRVLGRDVKRCRTCCEMLRPHSIILASCKPGCKSSFLPGLQPGFRQVRAGLRHAFDTLSTFLSKTWSRACCINLDMSRLMQQARDQVRWFVRVLDK